MADPPVFVDGNPATAEMLQALGSAPQVYTPTLTAATTSPNLGAGSTVSGLWVQTGYLVMAWFDIQFGTGGSVAAGSGQYRIDLPIPVAAGGLTRMAFGSGRANDNSVGTDLGSSVFACQMLAGDPTKIVMAVEEAVTIAHNAPWTWAASDYITGWCCYPGDFS